VAPRLRLIAVIDKHTQTTLARVNRSHPSSNLQGDNPEKMMAKELTIDHEPHRTPGEGYGALFNRPLTYPPLVPDFVHREYHTFVATDTRFAAAARLLSAIWREEQGIPIGSISARPNARSRRIKLGSRISPSAAMDGATFMGPEVMALARAELLFREPGSVWDEERLWGNLLSSQALTVNLWAPMVLDPELATSVWRSLLPDFVGSVVRIRFEHSPGRFQEKYFGDGTAFDVLLEVATPDGEQAIIAVELKYVEDLTATPARHRERYDETTIECGLYHDPQDPLLYRPGFEQLRREHIMAQLMIDNGLASRGMFITIVPRLNRRAVVTSTIYASALIDPSGLTRHDDGRERVAFQPFTLEEVVRSLVDAGAGEYASQLWGRYCDFQRVVRHVLGKITAKPKGRAPKESNLETA
jgi:hypothetical protein